MPARSLPERYVLEIEDKEGKHHSISALGLDSITVLPPDPDFGPNPRPAPAYSPRRARPTPRKC